MFDISVWFAERRATDWMRMTVVGQLSRGEYMKQRAHSANAQREQVVLSRKLSFVLKSSLVRVWDRTTNDRDRRSANDTSEWRIWVLSTSQLMVIIWFLMAVWGNPNRSSSHSVYLIYGVAYSVMSDVTLYTFLLPFVWVNWCSIPYAYLAQSKNRLYVFDLHHLESLYDVLESGSGSGNDNHDHSFIHSFRYMSYACGVCYKSNCGGFSELTNDHWVIQRNSTGWDLLW